MSHESLENAVKRLKNGEPSPGDSKLFGTSIAPDDSSIVVIPVPFEAMACCGSGTSKAPDEIMKASHHLDFSDLAFDEPYRAGFSLLETNADICELNEKTSKAAKRVREANSLASNTASRRDIDAVNAACLSLNSYVEKEADLWLSKGKFVGLVGGDHSSPYGLIKALSNRRGEFSILHIDAHLDLRKEYEGFKYSHASIMRNVLEDTKIDKLVSVAVRDFSEEEKAAAKEYGDRVEVLYDRDIFRLSVKGTSFSDTVSEILSKLSDNVYISFDIDGLEPTHCPSTGTPVPGGLTYNQAIYLLEELAHSGRKVIGFDLCEVVPGHIDSDVGARILYKLCCVTAHSNGLVK